jgi:tRNA A-37 threonylcarbamoyl transferase component Bud32
MLSFATRQIIDQQFKGHKTRVLRVETPEGPVLVKGQRKARDPIRYLLLGLLGKLLNDPLIKVVPAYGGKRAQAIEARRLCELRAAGVLVPELLFETPDYLVMQPIEGRPIDSCVSDTGRQALDVFRQGLLAICAVHAAGQYLSQGFARNMIIGKQGIWFIDFEEDPLQVMSLQEAQARDFLLFLLSLIWLNPAMHADWQAAWKGVAVGLHPCVNTLIQRTAARLPWLGAFPNRRRPLGRDIFQLRALAVFMREANR